jgi:hypothetical protein
MPSRVLDEINPFFSHHKYMQGLQFKGEELTDNDNGNIDNDQEDDE